VYETIDSEYGYQVHRWRPTVLPSRSGVASAGQQQCCHAVQQQLLFDSWDNSRSSCCPGSDKRTSSGLNNRDWSSDSRGSSSDTQCSSSEIRSSTLSTRGSTADTRDQSSHSKEPVPVTMFEQIPVGVSLTPRISTAAQPQKLLKQQQQEQQLQQQQKQQKQQQQKQLPRPQQQRQPRPLSEHYRDSHLQLETAANRISNPVARRVQSFRSTGRPSLAAASRQVGCHLPGLQLTLSLQSAPSSSAPVTAL
jgi:hypothetical protein